MVMETKEMLLAALLSLSLISGIAYFITVEEATSSDKNNNLILDEDPLIQGEGHDHMDASKHNIKDIKIAVEKGMKEKAKEFAESGNKIYVKKCCSFSKN